MGGRLIVIQRSSPNREFPHANVAGWHHACHPRPILETLRHRRRRSGVEPSAKLRPLTAARPPVTVPVMRIEVHDNQVESALKTYVPSGKHDEYTMKKLMLKDGLFKEMKKRAYYEKPSVKRKRKQAEARKKRRKAMKRAESDD